MTKGLQKERWVEAVSSSTQIDKKTVRKVFDSLLSEIVKAIKEEGVAGVYGLGRFVVKSRKERQFNFGGERKGIIPAKKFVAFRASRALKELIN